MFTFCKPVSSKKRFLPHRQLNEDFTFSLYSSANLIPENDWNLITRQNQIFLNKHYLEIIEKSQNANLKLRYVIVYYKGNPTGIIYFQIVDFKADVFGNLLAQQVQTLKSKRLNLFEKYIDLNKDEIILRLFTCGNNLVSGEYGFLFDEKIEKEKANTLLLNIIEIVAKEDKLKSTISAILLKDFYSELIPKKIFEDEKYSDFYVEPNLIIHLPENIKTIDDYVRFFSKKYRNRAKSIFKKFNGIEIKYLNLEEIKTNEARLYKLYEGVFERAKFKLVKLPKDYFRRVKTIFKNEFTIKVFCYENEIIGFASSFLMPDTSLEAHYIGFDYELNSRFDLYQNILYAMIDEALKNKCRKVNLGRTAAEIKTTVGAKPENLICYIKPQNTISKLIQKPFIAFLQPPEWIPRNPFKDEE